MKLSDWRAWKGYTQQELAAKLGITYQMVAKLEKGGLRRVAKRMAQIKKETKGRVKMEDWL